MPNIYENIAVTIDGADENHHRLLQEYERSLGAQKVSAKAADLTHQICAQLRSALDRTAYRYWETHIAASLSEAERADTKKRVYFPGASSQASFDSTLGNWRYKQAGDHQAVIDYLWAKQPFVSSQNKWLETLFDLSVQGKHIDLVPQKRFVEQRTTVSRGNSAVSWTGGVRFSGNVSVMGAPIDPKTQSIVPTPGVTQRKEIWVSFLIDGHGVNAAGFCKEACRNTRKIVQEMTDKFGLS